MSESEQPEIEVNGSGDVNIQSDETQDRPTSSLSAEKSKDETECKLCGEKVFLKEMKNHKKSRIHILNYEKKIREKGAEETQCKVCGERLLRKNMNEHKTSIRHVEEQKRKFGEAECDVCKEKYIKGLWKEHSKTETHMLIYQQKQDIKKAIGSPPQVAPEKTIYTLRPGSEENQQYINTLTTYFAVRYALNTDENFIISVNDKKWDDFGDIVIEIIDSNTKIETIRCKKVETKSNYTTLALSGESGKLSLKEQCEILKKLSEKNNDQILMKIKEGTLEDNDKEDTGRLTTEGKRELEEIKQNSYKNANFRLFTVSSIALDHNLRFNYDDEVLKNWQKTEARRLWKNRHVEIKQSKNINKDLFNTTDDADNVYTFQISNHQDGDLNKNLKKFHLYINQKKRIELQAAISTMIEDKFGAAFDISEELIKYIRRRFRTDKVLKKDERNFKLTKRDILLKITELLLAPFLIFSQRILKDQDLESWNKIIQEFDITVIQCNEDILSKIYKGLNYILKEKTKYSLDASNKVKIDVNNIEDPILKSHLYDHDQSLQSLYFALWKTGSAPLVLNIDDEKYLKLICNIVTFLKSKHFLLKMIVATKFKLVHNWFPKKLKVFLNLNDLKMLNKKCFGKILDLKFNILDSETSLKEIISCNEDFLETLTPDALLNLFLKDFSFIDVSVPMTRDIIEDTLVFDDVTKIQKYFQKRDGSGKDGGRKLTYLVSIQETPSYIQVPPEL